MPYIHLDSDNKPQYFLNSDSSRPESAIEITSQQYFAYLQDEDQGKTFSLVEDEIVVSTPADNRSIVEIKAQAISAINAGFTQAMQEIVINYPDIEIKSWPQQVKEAEAYQLDNTAKTTLLDRIVLKRGIDKAVLIDSVLEKEDDYSAVSGDLIGQRQHLEGLIEAIPDDATREDALTVINNNLWA